MPNPWAGGMQGLAGMGVTVPPRRPLGNGSGITLDFGQSRGGSADPSFVAGMLFSQMQQMQQTMGERLQQFAYQLDVAMAPEDPSSSPNCFKLHLRSPQLLQKAAP